MPTNQKKEGIGKIVIIIIGVIIAFLLTLNTPSFSSTSSLFSPSESQSTPQLINMPASAKVFKEFIAPLTDKSVLNQ